MREDLQQIGKEWLKSIPSNWEIDRLKDVCEKVVGGGTPKSSISEYWDGGDITWISPTDFSAQNGNKFITNSAKKITELGMQKSSATLIPKGTVVMSSRASIGEPKIAGCDITTNQGFVSYVPSFKIDSNFLFYLIEGQLGEYFAKIASGTTFMEITRRQAKHEHIPLPPLPEQKAIANYLDKACERIDKIIEIKQKQLEKIEGYYKSTVFEKLTKGIEKNTDFKASKIPYIGNVPKTWRIVRVKHVSSKVNSGVTPKGGSTSYVDDGIPLIRSQNVKFEELDLTDVVFIKQDIHSGMNNSQVKRGDVLLNITGASIGRCFYFDSNKEANVNQHVCIIRPFQLIITKFLFYLLKSEIGQAQIFSGFKGSGREGLSFEAIKNFKIPLPKKREQEEISTRLEIISKNINNLKQNITTQITTLKSYRKSLIHECVTGKKQVWAGAIENVN